MGRLIYTSQKWPKLAISMGTYPSIPVITGSCHGSTAAFVSTGPAWAIFVSSMLSSAITFTKHKYFADCNTGVYAASNTTGSWTSSTPRYSY
jgi:hypothetical protein